MTELRLNNTPLLLFSSFFISILLHLAILLMIQNWIDPTIWESGAIAKNIFIGKGFRLSFSFPNELTSRQAPGYPYLLAGLWKLFGFKGGYIVIQALQAVAIASMIFPVYHLADRWFKKFWVNVFAVVITVFMPLYGWYPTRIHHTAFVMALHPWILIFWLSFLDEPKLKKAFPLGVLSGFAGLFQPVLLAVYALIGLAGLAMTCRRSLRATVPVAVSGIVVLLMLIPWTVRNYQVHGKLMLVKNSFGKEFWTGNNPNATGSAYAKGGNHSMWKAFPPHCLKTHKGKVPEMELMEAVMDEAWAYCRSEPKAFVLRTFKKIGWFWSFVPKELVRASKGGEALKFRILQVGYWALFVFLILLFVILEKKISAEYAFVLLVYIFVYSLTYGLTHVGQARFRGEIEFVFIPLVSAGMWALVSRGLTLIHGYKQKKEHS